ncbi:MAG: Gfo/Idh/MocA family protein [Bacilli bacterium]
MKKVGLIGLGDVTKYYKMGFSYSLMLEIASVCDIINTPSSLKMYSNYPFYNDYKEMIINEHLDYVIIATPSSTHYEIAKSCLEMGVNVIVEAPISLSILQVDELLKIAKSKAILFDSIMCSSLFEDVLDVKDKYATFGKLKSIHFTVYGDFCNNTKLVDKRMLNSSGCFLENAFETFTTLSLFLPLKKIMLVEKKVKKDSLTKIDIRTNLILYVDGVDVFIDYDWTQGSNFKSTKFDFEKNTVAVCHSSRETTINLKEKISYNNQLDRNLAYYISYFKQFDGRIDYENIRKMHEHILKIKKL